MNEPIIEFRNFTFQYRAQKKPTLIDINLRVAKGEKILIAGPSGSGKSTLGCCLNGLIPFNNPGTISGELLIGGKKPESVFELSKMIGTVLQDTDGQFVGLSSGEDIAFLLENLARPQAEMIERVKVAATLVGAESYLTHSPQRLSGGQKQRVSMAGVLVDDAEILLFDEPLAALDPLTGKLATALIDDIATRTGATIVIIEHRLEDVLWKKIDRVILIAEGRIVADTTPDQICVSQQLTEVGIRRPLYINALAKAGVTKTMTDRPGQLATLALTEADKEKVRVFAKVGVGGEEKTTVSAASEQTAVTPLLEVKNLGFTYPETNLRALEDVSFRLFPGEMTAIVGANGAGKSTLAKLIVGFEETKTGAVIYRGEDMYDLTIPERAERIGYVMQNPNQMICKPMIYDEVALGLRMRGIAESEIEERIRSVLKVCGLNRFMKWPISALSYGQKKRVTIADALALSPEILILDEPTAGQDYRHYTDIMEFLRILNQEGVTVLLITHDMHLCLEYAKRALVFADGRLIADCPTYEVLSDPILAARASLKETSLYELANICGISEAKDLVRAYLKPHSSDYDIEECND
ncbi:MAG: ABC transporter ATP-binding protein [Lachnospiraceae bacterium]|jgi:energy-coupling factor transport system ATP-binding protein|nr:ABC transporter ATP-binding protein [Lachnospiraceae bacterium]